MDEIKYSPLIFCERCGKLTRHYRWGSEERSFVCEEERRSMTKAEKERLEKEIRLNVLLYACIQCGKTRGYGNVDVPHSSVN